jgi:eukaryotic-like serine/threonine-protein kinase
MPSDSQKARELFLHAVGKLPPERWGEYVAERCGGDAELNRHVSHLLQVHRDAGSFLESPAVAFGDTCDDPMSVERPTGQSQGLSVAQLDTVIGPYKLLQPIGEGGMGTVYMAEQTQPVQRKVALKLIKAGMDSRLVIARFGAERQALALMDHPSIAKVFDAGTTDDGRPYFVMELVKGIPITRFCDERRLTLRERLELAIPVCQAVQHAHQKGIIHRDLKPSNVLIALYDGKPVPKIIDFGVAKATGPRLTDQTLYTEFGSVVGTLEYMSPEQAELNQLDIDTRSDIYSLGVLLYELLTGSTPLEHKRITEGVFLELLRVIREDESPRPSVRLSTTEELPSIAACRHVEPRKLSGLVRGELDWIVMKALEKDRNRRYETANGLAADLRRYLDDEPVHACPPSAWYRFGKFARRNRAALLAAVLISVAMLAAVGMLAVSNLLITRQKNQKEAALLQARNNAKAANDQKRIAEQNARQADEQRGIAIANVKTAREQELLARHRFYAAQTHLAQQASESGQPARVLELLESLRPKFDQEDLRGFEWYYLWRLCHAGYLSTLRGHTGPIQCVAFSPDGRTLASSSGGNIGSAGLHSDVKLWDITVGRERLTLKKIALESFGVLAFAPDGKTLATWDSEHPMRLWDPASGQELASFNRPNRFAAYFADGKTLVTLKPQAGSAGQDLELRDAATGREKAVLRTTPGESIGHVAVAPDGQYLAAGTSLGLVRLWRWDGKRWQERASLVWRGWSPCIAFSPDGKTLVAGQNESENYIGQQETVKSYELGSGKEGVSFRGHIGRVHGLAFSRDGKIVASAGQDRTVKTWEAATGKELTCRPHASPVLSVAFSLDGKTLAAGCSDSTITLWETAPEPDEVVLSHGGSIFSLAFTADGKRLVSSGFAPTKIWDVATGQQCATPPMDWSKSLKGEDISSDARIQAFQRFEFDDDGTVTLCDLVTGRQGAVLKGHTGTIMGATFSLDGKTVATAGTDGTARLWDIATGESRATIRTMAAGVSGVGCTAVAFSPDGTLLATGTHSHDVALWDTATGQERLALEIGDSVKTGTVFSVAFSPDGKILAVSSDRGIVRLWDVATGASRGSIKGHTNLIWILAFSPDGSTLTTGSADKTTKLWDVATRQERLTLKGHIGQIMALAFDPDGKTLATGSADGALRIWHTSQYSDATARNSDEDPDDPETPAALNTAGERLWSIGRPEDSEKVYRRALVRASELTNAFPASSGSRQETARSWLGLALLLSNGGRAREAEQGRRDAMAILEGLPPRARQTLAFHYSQLTDLFRASGHPNRAEAASLLSVELGPESAMLWYNRSRFDMALGRTEEAVKDLSKLVVLSPTDPTIQNNLAWMLATCTDMKLRDPSRAIELAKQAVELVPNRGVFWNTLGAAHYRAGDPKAAIDALTKSMELRSGGDGNDWFFLAMAHCQLGEKDEARKWYDRAVPWMEKNQPKNEELIRFRAEAAAVLGVSETKH